MIGPQMQTPPMVSAIKIDGQRLHELARRGVEVERTPRERSPCRRSRSCATEDDAVWRFDVECSVGTYVRVLLSDLARRLGNVGHLVELRRLASGATLGGGCADPRGTHRRGRARRRRSGAAVVVRDRLDARDARRRYRHAPCVWVSASRWTDLHDEEMAAMDANGDLVGVLVRRNDSWKPELVLSVLVMNRRSG